MPKNRPAGKHFCRRRKAHLRKGLESKYMDSFYRTIENKKRRLARQIRKHPNDLQAAKRLKSL